MVLRPRRGHQSNARRSIPLARRACVGTLKESSHRWWWTGRGIFSKGTCVNLVLDKLTLLMALIRLALLKSKVEDRGWQISPGMLRQLPLPNLPIPPLQQ